MTKKCSSILILLFFLFVVILSVAKVPEQGALADSTAGDRQAETCSEEPVQIAEAQMRTGNQEETNEVITEAETQTVDKNTLSEELDYVPKENLWEMDLSEEEKLLLEEHVFGNWRFAERLFTLDEYQGEEEIETNFSEQGVETMKNMVVSYEKERIKGYNFAQSSFSNSKDVFLFMLYGGNNEMVFPVYDVYYEADTEYIHLYNFYGNQMMAQIQLPEKKTLIKVRYDLDTRTLNSYVSVRCLCRTLYIDPDDTETLYMDFCGFWKLERGA